MRGESSLWFEIVLTSRDEKPFFTQWYGNSKGVIVGTKIIMQKMITALVALENTATMEMRSGYSVLP